MKKDPRKVLIFQTAFLGDALLAIPMLKTLKWRWRDVVLGYVCRPGVGELLLQTKIVDQAIEVDKSQSSSLKKAFRATKEFGADVVISPHESFRTALWIWRLRAPLSVGFHHFWNSFAFDYRVSRPVEKHDVLRQLSLLEALDISVESLPPSCRTLDLAINSPEMSAPYIVLSPGSQWETKRWPLEKYIEAGRNFRSKGFAVTVVGTSAEAGLCAALSKEVPQAQNLCGKTTVLELARVLKGARLVICNDSGTMHVASCTGTPTVSIFGPTVKAQGYAPWSQASAVAEVDLPCRPCGRHGHRRCPLGTHDCMKKIEVSHVINLSERFL